MLDGKPILVTPVCAEICFALRHVAFPCDGFLICTTNLRNDLHAYTIDNSQVELVISGKLILHDSRNHSHLGFSLEQAQFVLFCSLK